MKIRKYINLLLLLVFSVFISLLVGRLLDADVLNMQAYGFQYLIFSILLSFVYFTKQNLRISDVMLVVLGISLIYVYLLRNNPLRVELGSILLLAIYILILFFVVSFLFVAIWFSRTRYLRALTFSILAALAYTFVHLFLHLFLGKPILAQFVINYFTNAFPIMLSIAVAFSIVEFVMHKLDKLFFDIPEEPAKLEDQEES